MTDLERRALLGDAEAQRECTEKGIVLACPHCKGNGKVSFKDHLFLGQNFRGEKKIIYRVQIICNKCRSRGKPIFTEPLINPNPYITKWGNYYAETEACKKETEKFLPYVSSAVESWNTRPAPQIGRCGECKHFYEDGDETSCSVNNLVFYKEHEYCSKFEPKGGEENGRTTVD